MSTVDHSTRVPVREGYDRWAATYDTDGNPLTALEERHIGSLIGEVDGLGVADVGCGTGRHAVRLAAAGARVTALDFSPRMLEIARTKAGAERVRFHLHDVTTHLPLDDGAVDRVLCCLVLEHVADLVSLFGELGRVCAPPPRGVIVVSAMHPAMMLRGVQARFHDQRTGARVQPASFPYQVSDYVMAARSAGLVVDHLGEHAVDAPLAAAYPRGARYVGWPMLLLMTLRREGGGGTS
ncbi:MAG TPA: class I SAM-dependent methyltransferase [Methylomirabilota bacterium]